MTEVTVAEQRPPEIAASPRCAQLSSVHICHFTTAHAQLKSRSFHRIFLPLARGGMRVTYISPAKVEHGGAIHHVSIPSRRSRFLRSFCNGPLLGELRAAGADLYLFQDPELLPLALVLKVFLRKRVIYDAYEDFPSMARDSRSVPRLLRASFARIVALAESIAARIFDGVITADPFTLRRLARNDRCRKLVFSNFPNLEFFPPPGDDLRPFDVVYRGGLSQRAGTYDLLNAVRLLKSRSRSVRLLLIGYFDNSSEERSFREGIRHRGLSANVELRGRIPHEEMAQTLSQAKIGVCPLRSTPKFDLNVPVKVFEYWACGLPVVASDLRPIRPYFQTTNSGLLFNPGDVDGLATAIEWLLDHPRLANDMGWNGRTAVVTRFNNDAEIHRLERLLMQIVGKKDSAVQKG